MLERLNKAYPDRLDIPSEEAIKRFISKAVARVKRKTSKVAGGNSNRGVPGEYAEILQSVVDCPVMCSWTPAQVVKYTRQTVAQKQEQGELQTDLRVPSDAQLKRKFRNLGSGAKFANSDA